jgi:two-component system sensor histidine kinase HydH
MLKQNLSLRLTGPTIFVSLLLFGLCIAVAVYLSWQQASTSASLTENVGSRKAAHDLEMKLQEVVPLLPTGSREVEALHEQIRSLLDEADRFADKDQERYLVRQLNDSFARYLAKWQAGRDSDKAAAHAAIEKALEILVGEILPTCTKLRDFNASQIEESLPVHSETVTWMAWGVAGVGSIGAIAGVLLGYGVARGLRQSIHRLSVRVRDAADKLGQDLPAVVLTEDGDLQHLHEQMQGVVGEIEQVIEKLRQREREVLRAEQLAAVGQLAAGVAHELRNPLTSIKMLVQANREESEARGLPGEDLHIVELEIRRMERCLQTFLDFARPPKPERRPLNLTEVVERTFALIGGRARKQHVQLRFTHPNQAVPVEADSEQMQQLLVNLTLNALDVMPRSGTLTVDLLPGKHGQVELRVLDTGPGIAPKVLARLFEPFVSSKETGLGLGLVVSRRIAESHGGTIQAGNRPEGGACFVVRLPSGDKVTGRQGDKVTR